MQHLGSKCMYVLSERNCTNLNHMRSVFRKKLFCLNRTWEKDYNKIILKCVWWECEAICSKLKLNGKRSFNMIIIQIKLAKPPRNGSKWKNRELWIFVIKALIWFSLQFCREIFKWAVHYFYHWYIITSFNNVVE